LIDRRKAGKKAASRTAHHASGTGRCEVQTLATDMKYNILKQNICSYMGIEPRNERKKRMRELRNEEHKIFRAIIWRMIDLLDNGEALKTSELMALSYMLDGICDRIEEELPFDDETYLFNASVVACALADDDLKRWERYGDLDGSAARRN